MPESTISAKPTELKGETDVLESPDFTSIIRLEIVTEYKEDTFLSSCFDVSIYWGWG